MSFTSVPLTTPRLNRSELAVPGSSPHMFAKALASAADIVFLDLEDAVAPDDKAQARANVIATLRDLDWKGSGKTVSVRINGLDTPYMYRDVVDVVEQAGAHLDLIMIPKVGVPEDVYALDMLITQIEEAMGHEERIGLELIIESALGMQNVHEIAAASPRLESLHFGVADYSASIGAPTTAIGGFNPDYAVLADADADRELHYADQWHYALARLVVAARANGLRPLDGPYGNFQDDPGFRAAAKRAAVLGCEGKWAIHPRQIPLGNEIFSPSAAEVARARQVLEAMRTAEAEGKGAVALDGRLLDIASVRQAEVLVRKAEMIAQAA